MQNRYSLRFDSTERQGESVPIVGRGFLVGRKPGSSLQIVDGSVSGRHAEFEVHEDHVLLRDLGSTNGTRVGSERVLEQRVHHGEKILFGNVEMTFIDAELAGTAPAATPGAANPDEPVLQGVSAEQLAAARGRRSFLPIVLIAVLAGTAGSVWFYLQQAGGATRQIRAVEAVTGNLLAGNSFEEESLNWSSHEASSADFTASDSAAYSGLVGLRAVVAEDEWALQRSLEFSVHAPGTLTLRAALDVASEARGRVGVEFLRAPAEGEEVREDRSLYAWSAFRSGTDGFDSVEFSVPVPEGFAFARAVLLASGDGIVDADDLSIVARSAGGTADFRIGEFELRLLGEEQSTAVLHKVDRFLISNLRVDANAASGFPGAPMTATADGETGVRLRFTGQIMRFSIEPDAVENGIATIGSGGYQVHSADFEREQVESLLIGIRKDIVRLKFPSPVKLTARPSGAGLDLLVEGATGEVLLQLDFGEESVEAGNLAYQARKQETDGEYGPCMTTWGKLLDDYPYESALVTEAEEVRGRLRRIGLKEVRAVREELDRGSFFRLAEIYRQCREEAEEVAQRFAGTSVEEEAREVVAEVDREVAGLESDLQSYERSRLKGIQTALQASEQTALAAEVGRYLDEKFGEDN